MNCNFNELSIELTHRCTLNCVYCSSDAKIDKLQELKLETLKNCIKEVKESFGVFKISLSGGESLLYSRFFDLFDFLKNWDMEVIIYTSGVILDEDDNMISIPKSMINRLKINSENPKIMLNVQGYDEKSIENINMVPNSFKLIQKTIDNLSSEKMFFGANVVPFKKNSEHLENIYRFCLKNGFKLIRFLRFVPQGRGTDQEYFHTPSEFFEVQKRIVEILKRNQDLKDDILIEIGHPINFLFLLNQSHLYTEQKVHYCRGGLDAPLISPSGEVSMCPAWKDLPQFKVGNIYEQNFDEIWNSENFILFRDFVKERYKELTEPCKSCSELQDCRGKCVAQRLLAHDDPLANKSLNELILCAPDPQCFKKPLKRDRL